LVLHLIGTIQGRSGLGKGWFGVQITRAVITAAGRGARQYPAFDTAQKAMLPLVDRDGLTKPVLQIIAEEALASGIEEIGVVSAPGDEGVYRRYFRQHAENLRSVFKGTDWADEQARRLVELEQRLHFSVQSEPRGYGHAVWCARPFVGDHPFLLLLGDHLYISSEPRRCARQLLDLAASENCAVSAVHATREHLIHQYGTLAGKRLPQRPDVYAIDEIIEKPNPTLAELRLQVPGLRAGHYLCFFGMHVLPPQVFDLLEDMVHRDVREGGQIQLTTALNVLARREKYLALETRGDRYNLGVKFGFVEAQIALALAGADRERMLAGLLESIVRIEQNSPAGRAS
jgi:UTP--glucose-1-phosphate uridylyltransferase